MRVKSRRTFSWVAISRTTASGGPLRKVWIPALARCAAVLRASANAMLWRFTSSRVRQLRKLRAQGRLADAVNAEQAMKRYVPNPRDGDRPWQWDCWWRPWVLCISEADDDHLAFVSAVMEQWAIMEEGPPRSREGKAGRSGPSTRWRSLGRRQPTDSSKGLILGGDRTGCISPAWVRRWAHHNTT